MNIRSTCLALATLGLLVAAPLAAQPRQAPANKGQRPMQEQRHRSQAKDMMFGVKLTPEQKKQMQTIRAKHAVECTASQQAFHDAAKAYRLAYFDANATPDQLKKLSTAMGEKFYALQMTKRAMFLEQRGILTAEQKTQMDERLKSDDCRPHGGMGFGR